MGKISFKNRSELLRLKESLNGVLDARIEKENMKELLKEVKSLPFYSSVALFESISDKLCNKNGMDVVKEFATSIIGDKYASTLYEYRNLLKAKNSVNDPLSYSMILSENISSVKDANKVSNKIANIVCEAIICTELSSKELSNKLSELKSDNLLSSLNYITESSKKAKTLEEYSNAISTISEAVKEKNVPNDCVNEDNTVESLNKLIDEQSETWVKQLIENVALATMSGKGRVHVFEEYKDKCLSRLDEMLSENETFELKSMKEKLSKKDFSENSAINDIYMMAELYNTLNE